MTKRWRKLSARHASVLFAVLATAFVVMAFQAAAAPAAPASTSTLAGLGKGALAGLLAAVIGWASQAKQADGSHEDWDWPQAMLTAVIGAGFGAIAAWKNIPLMTAENLPWVPFVLAGIEQGLKAVFRNLAAKFNIAGALATLKAGTSVNPTGSAPGTPPKQ